MHIKMAGKPHGFFNDFIPGQDSTKAGGGDPVVFARKTQNSTSQITVGRPHRTPPQKKTQMVADTGFGNFPEFQGQSEGW